MTVSSVNPVEAAMEAGMKIDFDAFRSRLETDLAQLDEALTQANVSAGTVMLDHSSVGRLSRMDAMQQQAMASSQRATLHRRNL